MLCERKTTKEDVLKECCQSVKVSAILMIIFNLFMTIQQDYLQVFELSEEKGEQKIEHSQEVPEYKWEHLFNVGTFIFSGKVFVIDDETHSTMLLASEY